MAALYMAFIIILILLGSVGLIVVGVKILRSLKSKKNLAITKYRIRIPRNVRKAAGISLVIVGGVLLFWVVWMGAEFFILHS